MHPTLESTAASIDRAVRGAPDEALAAAPPGKWSPAAILEHLALSYRGTTYAMRKAMDKGRPIGARGGVRQLLGQLLVVGAGWFPRVEAPEATRPKGIGPGDARRVVFEALEEMDAALTAAEERFGRRALVANHPIMGGFTVARWRRFHLQHARHHARQISTRLR